MVFEANANRPLPDSVRTVMNTHAVREANATWQDSIIDGFLQGAVDTYKKPGETAVKVGSGLAIGAAIQTGLNNAEMMGGKIGMAARLGKVAAVAVPLVVSAVETATSDRPAHTAGHMLFDTTLFLGMAKLGTYADTLPGRTGALFQPRATTPVPEGLRFRVSRDTVTFSGSKDFTQVRLANGKGFMTQGSWRGEGTTTLSAMPETVPGGRLQYGANSTTLVNESGTFSRSVATGRTSVARGVERVETDGKSISISRPSATEEVSFNPDGRIHVMQGDRSSGNSWQFQPDGSFSMRSLPAGKYKLDIGANGEGIYTYTHGTSRAIMGIGGPRIRHAPLVQDKTPVAINPPADGSLKPLPYKLPNIERPDQAFVANLNRAHETLTGVAPDRAYWNRPT